MSTAKANAKDWSLSGPQMEGVSVVGCYSLHLYCVFRSDAHVYGEFPAEFSGPSGGFCRKAARKLGWSIFNDWS